MKPTIEKQIEHYTNQVAIYLSFNPTDEPTLKFMIEHLNKLVTKSQALNHNTHNFTYMDSVNSELNIEINEKIKRFNRAYQKGLITRAEAQFAYLNFLTIKFNHSTSFNIYTNTHASFI